MPKTTCILTARRAVWFETLDVIQQFGLPLQTALLQLGRTVFVELRHGKVAGILAHQGLHEKVCLGVHRPIDDNVVANTLQKCMLEGIDIADVVRRRHLCELGIVKRVLVPNLGGGNQGNQRHPLPILRRQRLARSLDESVDVDEGDDSDLSLQAVRPKQLQQEDLDLEVARHIGTLVAKISRLPALRTRRRASARACGALRHRTQSALRSFPGLLCWHPEDGTFVAPALVLHLAAHRPGRDCLGGGHAQLQLDLQGGGEALNDLLAVGASKPTSASIPIDRHVPLAGDGAAADRQPGHRRRRSVRRRPRRRRRRRPRRSAASRARALGAGRSRSAPRAPSSDPPVCQPMRRSVLLSSPKVSPRYR
mmetsp:Transcript_151597/g.484578  ORF Transcript_151597/g.484578 Transcript_151597/m.484578 type:complete len:366 (-) Transcript_151597:364-1461(-)